MRSLVSLLFKPGQSKRALVRNQTLVEQAGVRASITRLLLSEAMSPRQNATASRLARELHELTIA